MFVYIIAAKHTINSNEYSYVRLKKWSEREKLTIISIETGTIKEYCIPPSMDIQLLIEIKKTNYIEIAF